MIEGLSLHTHNTRNKDSYWRGVSRWHLFSLGGPLNQGPLLDQSKHFFQSDSLSQGLELGFRHSQSHHMRKVNLPNLGTAFSCSQNKAEKVRHRWTVTSQGGEQVRATSRVPANSPLLKSGSIKHDSMPTFSFLKTSWGEERRIN